MKETGTAHWLAPNVVPQMPAGFPLFREEHSIRPVLVNSVLTQVYGRQVSTRIQLRGIFT